MLAPRAIGGTRRASRRGSWRGGAFRVHELRKRPGRARHRATDRAGSAHGASGRVGLSRECREQPGAGTPFPSHAAPSSSASGLGRGARGAHRVPSRHRRARDQRIGGRASCSLHGARTAPSRQERAESPRLRWRSEEATRRGRAGARDGCARRRDPARRARARTAPFSDTVGAAHRSEGRSERNAAAARGSASPLSRNQPSVPPCRGGETRENHAGGYKCLLGASGDCGGAFGGNCGLRR